MPTDQSQNACSQGYTDLASLGQLPKYTCGQLYYYPAYSHERDAEKLRRELCHNLTRTTGEAYTGSTFCKTTGNQQLADLAGGCTSL